MKALTIWQPWAELIASGCKRIETRPWATTYRGPLAIHAASKHDDTIEELAKTLEIKLDCDPYSYTDYEKCKSILQSTLDKHVAFGQVIATSELVDVRRIDADYRKTLSQQELLLGDYSYGRYAFILQNVTPMLSNVKVKGQQRLWNLEGLDG